MNKEVCKKCYKYYYEREGKVKPWWWNFKENTVLCIEYDKYVSTTNCNISCPYTLEHIVAERSNEVEKKTKLKLNKEICKACIFHTSDKWSDWEELDEKFWNESDTLLCRQAGDFVSIMECEIDCPYELEHIVANRSEEENKPKKERIKLLNEAL